MNPCIAGVCLTVLFASSSSHAQIYKWVDENGKTHYSERKDDADKAKAAELKIRSQAPSAEETDASLQYWQDKNRQINQHQAQKKVAERPSTPPAPTRPKSLSGGRADGSNASRCNLARDVLSGAVKLRNGLPTGAIERKIAEDDVRLACK